MMESQQRQSVLSADALVKRVEFHGQTLDILRAVSLQVYPGESVAIVGASGSGKSTLLSLLAGLDLPTSGTVHLLGQSLFDLSEDQRARLRRNQVGFVFQNFQLMAQLNALENVMLPLELAGQPDAGAQATRMLARLGLGSRLRHYPRQLSGGEQQRVALARAFVIHPQVLFADEPTGNLDPAAGRQIIDMLFELNAEQGTALIMVTHDNDLAQRCLARYRLDEGRLSGAAP